MKKTKSTKRALLMSALALITCVSMLVGSTFAWFTDSVTSGKNTIQSGNLDVKLEYSIQKDGVWSEYAEVTSTTDIFGYNNWEPGYTAIAKFRVTNAGSLALKYQLTADVYEEIPGVNVAGQEFLLSDYLYTEVVAANATREQILASTTGKRLKATVNGGINTDLVVSARALEKNQSEEVALAIWMPTTVGNEANHNGIKQPSISFGINLLATQQTYEKDSFDDQYDKDAPMLVWDGSVDTTWYDAAATSYELSSPAKLAGLAKLVNEGNSFAGKAIKLGADMDLNNIAWTPIGIKIDENTTNSFNGKLYGNGFTIYNLSVAGTKGVGLVGFAGNAAHIEGIHIVGANVTGENSVGAVLGYGYLSADCLKYCTVEDAIVYAGAGAGKEDGDKVGAVAGWTSNGNIIGNKAVNCEIYGCRDIGGVVGYVNGENRAVEVSGNAVDKVTVNVLKAADYQKELGSNVNDTVGRTGAQVTVQDNSGKIEKKGDVVAASTTEDLKAALANGGEVTVVAGTYSFPASSIKAGTTLNCKPGTVFAGGTGLNINGATVVGAEFSNKSGTAATSTINGVFKNCNFTGSNGLRWCYAGETVVFEDCTFSGDVYGVHFDGGANEVIFRRCTLSGFNALGGAITLATFEDCTFKANGRSGYNGINMWGNTEMKDCTFVFDGTAHDEWIDLCGANKTATFTNCVVTDGTTEKGVDTVATKRDASSKIIVDGVQMITSGADVSNALASTGSATLNSDVTYSSDFTKDSAIELNGNDFEATGTLTLTNNADLSMKNGSYTVNGTYGHVDVRPTEGSTLVFEGVDFSYNKKNNTNGPSTNRLGTVVEVCAIAADAKTEILFKDCTFDNAQVLFEGLSGTIGAFDATFDGCTFNALTSSAPIYVQNYVKGTLTVKNCTFNLTCTSSSASAISVSPSNSTSVTVNAENNTINATVATPTDSSVTGVDVVKVNGTPKNIKFISSYENTTVTETNTVKTGIAG